MTIEHLGGHRLNYAVSDSGKTPNLLRRLLFPIAQGEPPECICVLAFNKAAARVFAPDHGAAGDGEGPEVLYLP